MKSAEEIMNMLEAFDLTGSLRDAGELAGCSHHTVSPMWPSRRRRRTRQAAGRPQLIDEFLPKLEEWIERSRGTVRADIAHEKLLALGYTGSGRTTRRAVAKIKNNYTGMRNLPFHGYAQNQIWLEIVALAADLLTWIQELADVLPVLVLPLPRTCIRGGTSTRSPSCSKNICAWVPPVRIARPAWRPRPGRRSRRTPSAVRARCGRSYRPGTPRRPRAARRGR